MATRQPVIDVAVAVTATPDNTPVPGGGSWRWDIALPGWVENTTDHYTQPADTGALPTELEQE